MINDHNTHNFHNPFKNDQIISKIFCRFHMIVGILKVVLPQKAINQFQLLFGQVHQSPITNPRYTNPMDSAHYYPSQVGATNSQCPRLQDFATIHT